MYDNDKLVSVIMSCYNEKIDWVKQSIDSILYQTYKNIELIVVCDNPEYDDLKDLLIEYQNKTKIIKVIFNEKNLGLTNSLNIALKHCKGEFIARMDADDVSDKQRIKKQVSYLESTMSDFVMSGAYFMDEDGTVCSKSSRYSCDIKNIIKCLKYGNTSIHPTWLFKKSIIDELIEYNNVEYAEDYDFLCRVVLNRYKIVCIEEPLLKYRRRSSGITKSKRIEQEINSQIIAKSYRNSLVKGYDYNITNYKNQIEKSDIEFNIRQHNNFKQGREYLKNRQLIKGSFKIITVFCKSKLKRIQIMNYVRLIKMYKEDSVEGKVL